MVTKYKTKKPNTQVYLHKHDTGEPSIFLENFCSLIKILIPMTYFNSKITLFLPVRACHPNSDNKDQEAKLSP